MHSTPAPAALPVIVFLSTIAAARHGLSGAPALTTALLGGGVALGGRAGALIAAAALGLLVESSSERMPPRDAPGVVAEARGRICGVWSSPESRSTRSAPLCADWIRQGSVLTLHPPELRIEIPSTESPPTPGSFVEVRGSLARFPGYANEAATPPGRWRLRVKSGAHLRIAVSASPWNRWRDRWRRALDLAMLRAAAPASPGLALARGLVLGDTDLFEPGTVQELRRTGLAHLLAVSGFNVAVLLAVVGAGAGRRRRWPRATLFVATIAVYLALVGGAPSLQRASIMALAGVLVFVLKRPGSAPQALALAAGLLVACAPEALFDVGFQLSFGATACLLIFAARWSGAFGLLPRPVGAAFATSLAAQVGTLPSSVEAFGGLAPVAPLLNLLAIPWSALWMVLDLLWTALALLLPPAARLTRSLLDVGAWPLSALEALPPSPWIAAWVSGGWLAGTALALSVVIAVESLGTRFGRLWLLAPLILAGERLPPNGETLAVFADVGQGDAALIVGSAASVLVDGGGTLGRDLGSAVLWPLVSERAAAHLDLVILSHADSDHCAGLASLARYVSFDQVWLPPLVGPAPCVVKLAAAAGGRARWPRQGERFERPGLVVEVLHPRGSDRPPDDNAASLVVRVDAGGRSILLPGDIGGLAERLVAARAGATLRCDLLKVPHHGSATSSGAELLTAARPRWAVVSAGVRNSFGHPSDAVLQRLAARGVRTLRTDLQGEVVLRWRDGEPMRLELPASPRRAPP